jgi:hypothetical protein
MNTKKMNTEKMNTEKMNTEIGDIVEIIVFDDGRQKYKRESNRWVVVDFKFNRGKSIIKHISSEIIKPFSISSWKLNKVIL